MSFILIFVIFNNFKFGVKNTVFSNVWFGFCYCDMTYLFGRKY